MRSSLLNVFNLSNNNLRISCAPLEQNVAMDDWNDVR
jgi:hypothetical protein